MTSARPDSRPVSEPAADAPSDPPPRGAGRGRPAGLVSSAVKALVVLLLFGGLAVALEGGWERLGEYQWQFEPWAVGMALAVMIGANVWAALSWLLLARAFGASLAARPALRIYSTSNLGKYLPGKVWHAFARVYLLQQHGAPLALATTIVVTDIVMYIAAGLLVMLLAFPTIVGSAVDVNGSFLVGVALVGVVVGLALLHPAALNWGFRIAQRLMKRPFPPIEVSYATILKIFVSYVVLWVLNTVGFWAAIQAVHPISATALPTLGAIYATSYLSGLIVPLAPAGLGVREGLAALLLSQLIPVPAAAVASVLVRVLQVVSEGVCAAAFSKG